MTWPVCRWAGEQVGPERRACRSPLLSIPPHGIRPEVCLACPVRDHEPPAPPPDPPADRLRIPCLHLGAVPILRPTGCVRCWVYPCEVHGTCTRSKPTTGLACCATCADYLPDD